MSLFSQLQAASRSAPEAPKTDHRLANLRLGGQAQSTKALAKYGAAMSGQGWMTQRQIEGRLGYSATTATSYLHKLRAEGHIERRNRHGSTVYERRQGYEWRWLEKAQ